MAIGPCCNNPHNPVILSGAKDPLHACTITASARNSYYCAAFAAATAH
jgi:hypothetical protein